MQMSNNNFKISFMPSSHNLYVHSPKIFFFLINTQRCKTLKSGSLLSLDAFCISSPLSPKVKMKALRSSEAQEPQPGEQSF